MDWTALGGWLYEDSVPNFAKLSAHKIKVVYIDPRSGNAAATCSSLRANGFTPGIYYVPQWFPGPTPARARQEGVRLRAGAEARADR